MMTIFAAAETALFTPGHQVERLTKATAGGADVVIADLEDAVAPSDKTAARTTVCEFLTQLQKPMIVRVNPVMTEIGIRDLHALAVVATSRGLGSEDLAVMVPKFELAPQLNERLAELPQSVPIIGLVETVQGVYDVSNLAQIERVIRLAIGAVDLSAEIGCSPEGSPVEAARASVVMASVKAGIATPLDTPCLNFTDECIIRQHGHRAVKDGFGGSLCIHPRQLDPIKQAFIPTDEQIEWAKKVAAAGEGASAIDGQMIDAPVIRRAQALLSRTQL